ncbi:hypothetical protein L207DRAFT_96894 [Hyaloscypha variabilis F]|uniref:Uncharacterized protein n=1 Tax=Hyaloscypha variabilis (strain UAMH 11265 / GT02V1 / F) TaxID=1149755 RepID=A0A2J6RBI9_HYAVF|nr:hypothetical protein L207DRAFT_96894 [Hyaloscypha variabilis F]
MSSSPAVKPVPSAQKSLPTTTAAENHNRTQISRQIREKTAKTRYFQAMDNHLLASSDRQSTAQAQQTPGNVQSGSNQSDPEELGRLDPRTFANGESRTSQPTALPGIRPSQEDFGQLGSTNQLPNSPNEGQSREPSPAMNSKGSGSSTESNEQQPGSSEGTNGKAPESAGRESERLPESNDLSLGPNIEPTERTSDSNELAKQEQSGS